MTAAVTNAPPGPRGGGGSGTNHLRIAHGLLDKPSESPVADAAALVEQCSAGVPDPKEFPPRLYILWVAPAFVAQARPLVEGVYARLQVAFPVAPTTSPGVPLVGASVAACVLGTKVYDRGALLVCLASRFIDARAVAAPIPDPRAAGAPAAAAADLLGQLRDAWKPVPSSPRSRFLVTFLPGYGPNGDSALYQGAELVDALDAGVEGAVPLFGGVSSGGPTPYPGVQFCNRTVYPRAVVAAEVRTDLAYGMRISQAVKPPSRDSPPAYHIEKVSGNGRTIKKFFGEDHSPRDVVGRFTEPPWVLGLQTLPGEHVTLIAQTAPSDAITVQRPVAVHEAVRVLAPDDAAPQLELDKWKADLTKFGRIPPSRVVAGLGVDCASRYSSWTGVDTRRVEEGLAAVAARYPGGTYAGALMDGEIGLDRLGRSVFANWSVSEFLLADYLTSASIFDWVSTVVFDHAWRAYRAPSLRDAMTHIEAAIRAAGFQGGMISLVLQDQADMYVIGHRAVGQPAVGQPGWEEVRKATKRKFGENDVLPQVVADGVPRLNLDGRRDDNSDRPTATDNNVISFQTLPLADEKGDRIGVLQLDLGDISDLDYIKEQQARGVKESELQLPPERLQPLRVLAQWVSVALRQAMQTEELAIGAALEEAVAEARKCTDPGAAVATFLKATAAAVGADGYVRLVIPETEPLRLRLVGGRGGYYEAVKAGLVEIDLDKPEFALVAAAAAGTPLVANDVAEHEGFKGFLKTFNDGATLPEHRRIGAEHRKIGSYAIYPVLLPDRPELLGLLAFHAPEPWFFSPSRVRSLANVGRRLGALLAVHASNRSRALVRGLIPPQVDKRNLYYALRERHGTQPAWAERVRELTGADVLSLFLCDRDRVFQDRDREEGRYVLRATAGPDGSEWPKWVDAAWFAPGAGPVGRWAKAADATYIPDLVPVLDAAGGDGARDRRHLGLMFPAGPTEATAYEALAIPLRFQNDSPDRTPGDAGSGVGVPAGPALPGLLLLHRRWDRNREGALSGFATVDPGELREVAQTLSAALYAMAHRDWEWWEGEEHRKRETVVRELAKPHDSWKGLARTFCDQTVKNYRIARCTVYARKAGTDDQDKLEVFTEYVRGKKGTARENTASPRPAARSVTAAVQLPPNADGTLPDSARAEIEERNPADKNQNDPDTVKAEGLVFRVALPLWSRNECLGVLVMEWKEGRGLDPEKPVPRHSFEDLRLLANDLADAMWNHRVDARATIADRVIVGATAYLFRKLHTLSQNAGGMRQILEGITLETPVEQVVEKLKRLQPKASVIDDIVTNAQKLNTELSQRTAPERDLNILLSEVIEARTAQATAWGVEIDFKGNSTFTVRVFPHLLLEAFDNVISNALNSFLLPAPADGQPRAESERVRESADDGDEVIRLFRENGPPKLEIKLFRSTSADEVIVQFTNNGPKLPPAVEEKVRKFEPQPRTKTGSGYGLLLTRLICEHHRGRLTFPPPSEPGTVVEIILSCVVVEDER